METSPKPELGEPKQITNDQFEGIQIKMQGEF